MNWQPPMNFEERVKACLFPPRLQMHYYVARERTRGEPEIGLVPFLANRHRVSVDAGANKGVWSEVLRRHSQCVHAFEPNPKIYRKLQRGAGAGVVAHLMALSDRSGTAELMVPKSRRGYSNQGASLSTAKLQDVEHRRLAVTVKRLDDLDLGDIGFMKIDVEGHELEVLEGARATLRRCRPNLVVELEERHTKRPIAELLGEVCRHGYEAFALDRGVLRRAKEIDLAGLASPQTPPADYIFNWVFLPV